MVYTFGGEAGDGGVPCAERRVSGLRAEMVGLAAPAGCLPLSAVR